MNLNAQPNGTDGTVSGSGTIDVNVNPRPNFISLESNHLNADRLSMGMPHDSNISSIAMSPAENVCTVFSSTALNSGDTLNRFFVFFI